jgi:multidrug resistance efflux pump
MKKIFLLFSVPILYVNAYAISPNIDFTTVVSDHAMLIILILICLILLGGMAAKLFLEKLESSLQNSQNELTKKNDQVQTAQSQINKNEIDHLKFELNSLNNKYTSIETRHNACQSTIPVTYVSRSEHDRFVSEHKQELMHISTKVENMIKDLKTEIREDLEAQIERILKLLEAKLG